MSWDNNDLFTWDTVPEEIAPAYAPKAPFADCANCPLALEPCVPSYVPTGEIKLIIVGEAPGYNEVQLKAPFVGASGKLLDAVLEHIEIPTEQCYKTNAVLCRPPKNDLARYSTAVKACSARLRAELSAIECNDIVALGGTAVGALDALSGHSSNDGILKRRGHWYDLYKLATKDGHVIDHKSYLATLHPAFVLRSAGYISQFLTDMRTLKLDRNDDRWQHVTPIVVGAHNQYQLVAWLSEVVSNQTLVSFDVETRNLDRRSDLLALGLTATTAGAWIVPGALIRSDGDLREILTRFFSRARLVAHNGKFDQQVLAHNGLGFFELADDTMLMHYALDEMPGTHGLKQLAAAFLGVYDYEAAFIDAHFKAQEREVRDYGTIPTEHLYQYLALDCALTLALQRLFDPIIDADNVRQAYQIALDASNALQHSEFKGIKIDRAYLHTVNKALDSSIEKTGAEVQRDASALAQAYLVERPSDTWAQLREIKWVKTVDQYRRVLEKLATKANLNSWQQMQVLLYDILRLKHTLKLGHKTDPRSTGKEALASLEYHPFLAQLREYRRLTKIKGTYVEKLLTLADEHDRVHISFNIHGTETGRLSANDGLHGIPRPSDIWGRAVRGSFIAAPGHKLVMCDYSQAELRAFAAETKEPFLLEAYNNDEDVHGNMTQEVFADRPIVPFAEYDKAANEWHWSAESLAALQAEHGLTLQDVKDIWKELRTYAKNINFGGLVYLGGPNGIAAMMGGTVTAKQIAPILSKALARMPLAQQWQKDQFRLARDQHFVQSRFGNKRRFMLITEETLDEVKKASVNAPIQNSASQLTLLSGIELTRKGIPIVHYNHDQLMAEVPEHLAERTAELIQSTMVAMGVKYFPEVKWRADVEIGDRWYAKPPTFDEKG